MLTVAAASLQPEPAAPPVPPRPRVRGDCRLVPRPCPFTDCKWHLAREGKKEPRASCCLDLADEGGLTLEEVGTALSVTRERIRQLEVRALRHFRAHALALDFAEAAGLLDPEPRGRRRHRERAQPTAEVVCPEVDWSEA